MFVITGNFNAIEDISAFDMEIRRLLVVYLSVRCCEAQPIVILWPMNSNKLPQNEKKFAGLFLFLKALS
jgi:hypothetical protein